MTQVSEVLPGAGTINAGPVRIRAGSLPGAPMFHQCKAKQFSDQMVCKECCLRWDINYPEPPPCNPQT